MPSSLFSTRRHLFVFVAYFLLTLVLTYPLILHFTTHVAGDGSDDPALAWNLWWVRYALLDAGQNPIYSNFMFFPIGLNLGFYTLTYLNAFLSIPIQFTAGLIPAANLNLFASFTLSGFGTYLLVIYLLRRTFDTDTADPHSHALETGITLSAFVAGLLYAFSANKFLYASLGQFNIASSQWIPFYILCLLKIFHTPKPPLRYGFLLGLFLLAQALSEFIFASFLILFTFAYVVYWLITTLPRVSSPSTEFILNRVEGLGPSLRSLLPGLLFAVLVFVIPMSPILAAMFSDLAAEGDFIQQGLGFSNIFSADVLGFFIPSHLHPLFGTLETQFHFSYINFMYLGFVALVLGIVAVWKVKPARIWGFWFVLIALLTLGPTLRFNGAEWDLPLPFDLLLDIPLVKGNRYPSRWSVMLTLCLAILVGYGLVWLFTRIADGRWQIAKSKRRTVDGEWRAAESKEQIANSDKRIGASYLLSAICAFFILFEHLAVPLPLSDFRVPDVYSQIAREPGNFSVLEIPIAWRNGFRVTGSYRGDSQGTIDRIFMFAQWYQTTQQHPILNGNTSRNPEYKFQYFTEAPILRSLIAVQRGHEVDEAQRTRDKELAPRLLQFFNTRYIVWHAPFEETNRDVANKTRAYVEETFPVTKMSETYENGRGVVVYRVNALPASESLVLQPKDPLARLYLGEGWSAIAGDAFLAERNEAKIFVSLVAPRDLKLTLANFVPYPSSGQGLTLRVNGQTLTHYSPLQITDGSFTIPLPASVLQSGMNEITFVFDKTLPVANLPSSNVSIVVRSAGEEQGAFGHIYVNGVDESPNERGYNVVVVEPRTGKIVARANFDTFLSGREATRMSQFIDQVGEGDLVAVAASDTVWNPTPGTPGLTQQAVDALKSIGAREDLRGKFRWSHAIIGVKGSLPGSASELASEYLVSQVNLNAPLTAPTIAASIGEIRIEPAP